MKKLLAIIAIIVIGSSFSFAADSWSNPEVLDGHYSARFYCLPGLTGPTGSGQSSNFFDDFSGDPGMTPMVWTLKGPDAPSYTVTASIELTTKPSPCPNPVLITDWSLEIPVFGLSVPHTNSASTSLTFDGEDHSEGTFGCQTGAPINVDILGLNGVGKTLGSYTWTITVSATATLL